jgi:hypothetical protein
MAQPTWEEKLAALEESLTGILKADLEGEGEEDDAQLKGIIETLMASVRTHVMGPIDPVPKLKADLAKAQAELTELKQSITGFKMPVATATSTSSSSAAPATTSEAKALGLHASLVKCITKDNLPLCGAVEVVVKVPTSVGTSKSEILKKIVADGAFPWKAGDKMPLPALDAAIAKLGATNNMARAAMIAACAEDQAALLASLSAVIPTLPVKVK